MTIIMAAHCMLMTSCKEPNTRIDLGYGVIADRGGESSGGHYKLTYGDSLIAPSVYNRIDRPDSVKSIVFPYVEYDGFHYADIGYAILDLRKRQYIFEENAAFPIDTIIPINRLNYKLYRDGRHFSTLILTDNGDENYDAEIVPYFGSSTVSISEFIQMGEKTIPQPKDGYIKEMQLSWAYDDIIRQFPIYELEYIAWHHLVESIVCYMDYMYYNTAWYQCNCMDDESVIMNLITERHDNLAAERKIISGERYICNLPDPLKTISDIEDILSLYHNTKDAGYYHPIWNEIRPALNEWIIARETIASRLPYKRAQIYRRLQEKMIDELYYQIKSIDYREM